MRQLLTSLLGPNWRTSSLGWTGIIANIVHLAFAIINDTWRDETLWTRSLIEIAMAVGLIKAGDAAASAPKQDLDQVKDAVRTGDTSLLKKNG